jgi:hypothetical protein
MSEREFPIEPHGVAYDCDECGEEMKPASMTMRMTNPPQMAHECPAGHIIWLTERYPTVRWRHRA